MRNASPQVAAPRRGLLSALVVTMRPSQWVKNLFVFGPILFSHKLWDVAVVLKATAGFGIFCLASSAIYTVNDLMDLEADRLHPTKRFRPVAAGEVSRNAAVVLGVVLAALAGVGVWMLQETVFGLLVLCYVLLNLSYSLGLKRVVIIDVMMIGAGFVLRVLAGAAAIEVSPSHWLVLCTILLSVFLGFTKRRAELMTLQDRATDHREVLVSYSASFLDQMISVVTAATLMCYVIYVVDERTLEHVTSNSRGLLLTVPFVMYGIFRYLYLVYRRDQGGSPTSALLHDSMMIIDIVLWALLCMAVIYFPEYFKGWFTSD